MVKSILSLAVAALSLVPSLVVAAPTDAERRHHAASYFPVVDQWIKDQCPGKWNYTCNDHNMKIRKDFSTMAPAERKAYTDAIKCLRSKPSQLDQTIYPAATDRYMDYAVTHVNRTKVVHLDAFFLTWHRYFLHLFENDLAHTCGYHGSFPYWNWPATADNLTGSAVFNGDEYSMSGDGEFTNNDPIVLAPGFALPHGSGGGCIKSGPFKGWTTTMADIPITVILAGLPLPPTAFQLNETCLTRDLNTFVAKTWTNYTDLTAALTAANPSDFNDQINGVLGGTSLGLHSGAHFTVGSPGSSLFVSPMDPIWWPLHTMLDHVYTSWQMRHPDQVNVVFGTLTAANQPPSANGTLDSVEPDWGYFDHSAHTIGELLSTTSGPFCYKYDVAL